MFAPLYLLADPGSRFAVHHPAQGTCAGLVLYLHPLAEEMNKARRMAALQARALAATGFEVLQIDLLGCGDSSGDNQDASWAAWQRDTVAAVQWLRQRHTAQPALPLWLWGLRSGALLATSTAQSHAEAIGPCHFLFWQPALQGKSLLLQWLRLKTAGQLALGRVDAAADDEGTAPAGASARGSGTEQLRQQLQRGHTLEVAGYKISPGLALGLEAATLTPPALAANTTPAGAPRRVVWLEASPREMPALLPPSQTAVSRWQQAGYAVQAQAVRGPAFWQTTEIEDAPALLQATSTLLAAEPAALSAEAA